MMVPPTSTAAISECDASMVCGEGTSTEVVTADSVGGRSMENDQAHLLELLELAVPCFGHRAAQRAEEVRVATGFGGRPVQEFRQRCVGQPGRRGESPRQHGVRGLVRPV